MEIFSRKCDLPLCPIFWGHEAWKRAKNPLNYCLRKSSRAKRASGDIQHSTETSLPMRLKTPMLSWCPSLKSIITFSTWNHIRVHQMRTISMSTSLVDFLGFWKGWISFSPNLQTIRMQHQNVFEIFTTIDVTYICLTRLGKPRSYNCLCNVYFQQVKQPIHTTTPMKFPLIIRLEKFSENTLFRLETMDRPFFFTASHWALNLCLSEIHRQRLKNNNASEGYEL